MCMLRYLEKKKQNFITFEKINIFVLKKLGWGQLTIYEKQILKSTNFD